MSTRLTMHCVHLNSRRVSCVDETYLLMPLAGVGSLPDLVCTHEPYHHVHGTCCIGARGTTRAPLPEDPAPERTLFGLVRDLSVPSVCSCQPSIPNLVRVKKPRVVCPQCWLGDSMVSALTGQETFFTHNGLPVRDFRSGSIWTGRVARIGYMRVAYKIQ
jgi:hypothetical protein